MNKNKELVNIRLKSAAAVGMASPYLVSRSKLVTASEPMERKEGQMPLQRDLQEYLIVIYLTGPAAIYQGNSSRAKGNAQVFHCWIQDLTDTETRGLETLLDPLDRAAASGSHIWPKSISQ